MGFKRWVEIGADRSKRKSISVKRNGMSKGPGVGPVEE